MRRLRFALTTIAMLAVPVAAGAKPAPFQLEASGFGATPLGNYNGSNAHAADLIDSGPGWSVGGSFGITNHFVLGARTGAFRNHHDPENATLVYRRFSAPDTTIAYTIERSLFSVPVHAFLQYRRPLRQALGFFAEGGLGMTSHTSRITVAFPNGFFGPIAPVVVVAHQKSFSFLLGGGVSQPIGRNFEVTLGADYERAITKSGDAWRKGDDPTFLVTTLGIRYPR